MNDDETYEKIDSHHIPHTFEIDVLALILSLHYQTRDTE